MCVYRAPNVRRSGSASEGVQCVYMTLNLTCNLLQLTCVSYSLSDSACMGVSGSEPDV